MIWSLILDAEFKMIDKSGSLNLLSGVGTQIIITSEEFINLKSNDGINFFLFIKSDNWLFFICLKYDFPFLRDLIFFSSISIPITLKPLDKNA